MNGALMGLPDNDWQAQLLMVFNILRVFKNDYHFLFIVRTLYVAESFELKTIFFSSLILTEIFYGRVFCFIMRWGSVSVQSWLM